MGIFGTPAEIIFDINLIVQIFLMVWFVIGSSRKNFWKQHGSIMVVGIFINLATLLAIMLPSLITYWGAIAGNPLAPGNLITLFHAGIGLIAIIIGFIFTARFLKNLLTGTYQPCGTPPQMRITIALWFITFALGVIFYLYFYVFQL